jgi:hypothetical protein
MDKEGYDGVKEGISIRINISIISNTKMKISTREGEGLLRSVYALEHQERNGLLVGTSMEGNHWRE